MWILRLIGGIRQVESYQVCCTAPETLVESFSRFFLDGFVTISLLLARYEEHVSDLSLVGGGVEHLQAHVMSD